MTAENGDARDGAARFRAYWEREIADPEFGEACEGESPRKNLWLSLVEARKAANLTQAEVAARLGVSTSEVSRIERLGYDSCTIRTLRRYLAALGGGLAVEVRLVPAERDGPEPPTLQSASQ